MHLFGKEESKCECVGSSLPPLLLRPFHKSLVVKHLLIILGTLGKLRWAAVLTVPGTPAASPRWEMTVGIISHPLTALECSLSEM